MTEILSTITIEGNIFFKAKMRNIAYVKLVPCYDVQYGIVVRIMTPTASDVTLDKTWLKIEFSSAHDIFRFKCPSFLSKYIGAAVETYEDDQPMVGELCKIRLLKSDFSEIKWLIPTSKAVYQPWFSCNGRLHISLSYVRNNFTESAKREPYVQVSLSVDDVVINHKIVVSIFSGKYLTKGELAFKLKKYEHELVTPPINTLLNILKRGISNYEYRKHLNVGNVTKIYMEENKSERPLKRAGQRSPGIRQRAQRARRERDANRRAEEASRRKKGIFEFKRKRR